MPGTLQIPVDPEADEVVQPSMLLHKLLRIKKGRADPSFGLLLNFDVDPERQAVGVIASECAVPEIVKEIRKVEVQHNDIRFECKSGSS